MPQWVYLIVTGLAIQEMLSVPTLCCIVPFKCINISYRLSAIGYRLQPATGIIWHPSSTMLFPGFEDINLMLNNEGSVKNVRGAEGLLL